MNKLMFLFAILFFVIGCSSTREERINKINNEIVDYAPDTLTVVLGIRNFESVELVFSKLKKYEYYFIYDKRFLFENKSIMPQYVETFYELKLLKKK